MTDRLRLIDQALRSRDRVRPAHLRGPNREGSPPVLPFPIIDLQAPLIAPWRQGQARPDVDSERMIDGRTLREPRGTANLKLDFHHERLGSEGRRNLYRVEAIGCEQS